MDCHNAKEYFNPYIDGALNAAQIRELEQHLLNCPDCAQQLAKLRSICHALRTLPPVELPPGFNQAFHEKLSAEPTPQPAKLRQRGWFKGLLAAACFLLVVGTLYLGGGALTGSVKYKYAKDESTYASISANTGTSPSSTPPPMQAPMAPYDMDDNISYKVSALYTEGAPFPEEDYDYPDSTVSYEGTEDGYYENQIAADVAHTIGATTDLAEPEMLYIQNDELIVAETESGGRAMSFSADGGSSTLTGSGTDEVKLERKIIRDANLSLKVDDFTTAYNKLNGLAEHYGGYVVSSNAYSNDGEKMQYGHVILRVQANLLNAALAEIENLGKLENKNTYTQDITMEYYDIAGRLTQYRAQEKRLVELYAQADSVEDIMQVERELTHVRAQLESLNGQIRYYDQMTTLSSISVDLYQPDVYTQIVKLGGWAGLRQDIHEGFIGGINRLIRGVSSLMVGFASLLPILFILAIATIVLLLLIRSRLRKKKR
ncbi:MAG: DUF4349 domain-containing protein [Clostridiales bacterium]|nr:DUF4349 domain-containing protein [Clostridiales bacterium]